MAAYAVWPVSLPISPLLASYTERYSSVVTSVTTGNKSLLVRRNATRTQPRLDVSFMFTPDQVGYFLVFFNNTLDGGSRRFTFDHPRTLEEIECSFDPTIDTPFTITPADNATMEYYKLTTTFIIWN